MASDPASLHRLKLRAQAGDAAAQYALSAGLAAEGRQSEARRWLEAAATQDFPDAVLTLSAAFLTGAGGVVRDPKRGAEGVRRAASLGSTFADCTLASLYAGGLGCKFDWKAASAHLADAIAKNHPVAMRMAAMVLFMTDPDDLLGAALVEASAKRDGVAAAIAVRRAILGRRGASTRTAQSVLPLLRGARYPRVAELQETLANAPAIEEPPGAADVERISEKLAQQEFDVVPTFEQLSEHPNIRVTRGAFSVEECEYMIGVAAPRLERAMIVDGDIDAARIDPHRTAWTASFHPASADLPFVLFAQRLARIAGIGYEHGETLNILRYRPGEEYRPHHDFLSLGEGELARRGQRVRTALIYLNTGFEGGQTHFLTPDISFLGAPGDVVVFENVDETGEPDVSARHASLPVSRGEKWLASLWFRDRPYEF